VADNCSDATASLAARAGAEVLERRDDTRRGKGHALAWAIAKVLAMPQVDAICVVDADCTVAPNLLHSLAAHLQRGVAAVQAPYVVANPEASTVSALRYAGYALVNYVRPLGRDELGLSAGLLGTGMAFSAGLLERHPWSAFSFAEDREQHMRWVGAGVRVAFARETWVASAMPTHFAASASQQSRWESGRLTLLLTLTPKLLRRAADHRDVVALDCALEPIQPPQALLLTMSVSGWALAGLTRSRTLTAGALASLLAQLVYVLGGLRLAGAPAPVWRALAAAPWFVTRRLLVIGRVAAGRGPRSWERTQRAAHRSPE
jgi:cellulose synthase/poly-beta-1,6-N-acetylglucosamine synthase-like glycosyltransferase